jgi:AAA domain
VISRAVDDFLGRLDGVKTAGQNQWAARCPCRNDDNNPSLSIAQSDATGDVLVSCHRGNGCDTKQICDAMGIKVSELFNRAHSDSWVDKPSQYRESSSPQVQKKSSRKLVATYKFRDENGTLMYEKLRYVDENGKKSFGHRRPDPDMPGEYIYDAKGIKKILYRLPEVIKAINDGEPVWLVEGEKDVDALVSKYGVCATTMSSGAGHWEPEYSQLLSGAEVLEIVADNDEPGKNHALHVAAQVRALGGNVRVWVSHYGKDISDHIASGHEPDELEELDYELPEDAGALEAEEDESAGERILDIVQSVVQNGDLSLEQMVNRLGVMLNAMSQHSDEDTGRLYNWQQFLEDYKDRGYEWIIPGLLEKQERVIVVAAEGVGKTMLARQVAICSAAGVHPFTFQPMQPITTLMIDLENPERIIQRTSNNIMREAVKMSKTKKIDAHLYIQPAGLDLTSSRDRAVIERLCEQIKPQLIVLGPLYKAYVDNGTRTSEALAVEVAKFLDRIRDIYGCAFWLEHHAPLGTSSSSRELRPFGSSVWSRWPEFGISLTPDPIALDGYVYEVNHFRGARDNRAWPIRMKRATRFPFETLEFMKMH